MSSITKVDIDFDKKSPLAVGDVNVDQVTLTSKDGKKAIVDFKNKAFPSLSQSQATEASSLLQKKVAQLKSTRNSELLKSFLFGALTVLYPLVFLGSLVSLVVIAAMTFSNPVSLVVALALILCIKGTLLYFTVDYFGVCKSQYRIHLIVGAHYLKLADSTEKTIPFFERMAASQKA